MTNSRRTLWVGLATAAILVALRVPAEAGGSNSLLDISADSKLLIAANRDNGTVSVVDLEQGRLLREIRVGPTPEGISFVGATEVFAVAVYGADRVALFDAATGSAAWAVDVFDEPYGVVSNADGSRLYVTLDYPGQVLEIDTRSRSIVRTIVAGPFARGLALAPGEKTLYVTEYYTGSVLAIDLSRQEVLDRWPGTASENLARQIVVHPRRSKAYVPHIRSRVRINQGEGSVVPFVSVVDTVSGTGRRRKPIPMDSLSGNTVVANPWEAALAPDGSRLCVVFAGTDDLFVCDTIDDDYREIAFRKHLRAGHNPRAVRFTPDGNRLCVYNTLDFEVAIFDSRNLTREMVVRVCDNPLGDEVLRGKILFYSALQPMVGRRWISCASCHPDGDADGRTWLNPEGLRNTTALYGMAWTHPIHWSADRDEVQDFEHTIRSRLMQGTGLIKGPVNDSLGPPNRGLSADLDALAAYSNSHHFPLSPHAKQGLGAAARRGRELFFSSEVGCAQCHKPPLFTDSVPAAPFRLHDVGTGGDDPDEKLGPRFDTPTLLGIYRTAPYLHHGRAATLEEVLTSANPHDRHGRTNHLNQGEIADLAEFLRCLPYEDPEPPARQQGLIQITR